MLSSEHTCVKPPGRSIISRLPYHQRHQPKPQWHSVSNTPSDKERKTERWPLPSPGDRLQPIIVDYLQYSSERRKVWIWEAYSLLSVLSFKLTLSINLRRQLVGVTSGSTSSASSSRPLCGLFRGINISPATTHDAQCVHTYDKFRCKFLLTLKPWCLYKLSPQAAANWFCQ